MHHPYICFCFFSTIGLVLLTHKCPVDLIYFGVFFFFFYLFALIQYTVGKYSKHMHNVIFYNPRTYVSLKQRAKCRKTNINKQTWHFFTIVVSLFTGRREFVQRLKLEGTLNVHDGCVSALTFFFFPFSGKCPRKINVCVGWQRKHTHTMPCFLCQCALDREQLFDFRPCSRYLGET